MEVIDKQALRAKRIRQLLSTSQKNDIKKAFDYFDQNGAGKIKKKELKVILRALGFDPTNEELDKLVVGDETDPDSIDFQEFMDIMLTKIEQQLSIDDIKHAFQEIASSRDKDDRDKKYIDSGDIAELAKTLKEKLTLEEIEEMLYEAIETGKIINKEESTKAIKKQNKTKKVDTFDDDEEAGKSRPKKVTLHDFKAILKWENN
jgi:centrin-1